VISKVDAGTFALPIDWASDNMIAKNTQSPVFSSQRGGHFTLSFSSVQNSTSMSNKSSVTFLIDS